MLMVRWREVFVKAISCVMVAVLAAGMFPAPALARPVGAGAILAGSVALQSTSDKVNVMEGGSHAKHRNLSVGDNGSYKLSAKAKSSKATITSCTWSADDSGVVALSAASGAEIDVAPVGEGCTYVRLAATLSVKSGSKTVKQSGADECMFTVWTPVTEVDATVTSSAEASWGAEDDEGSSRGQLAAGTRVTVIGECVGRYRVRADAAAYADGDASQYSFVDMDCIELDEEPEDPDDPDDPDSPEAVSALILEGGAPAAFRDAVLGGAPLSLSGDVEPEGAEVLSWS